MIATQLPPTSGSPQERVRSMLSARQALPDGTTLIFFAPELAESLAEELQGDGTSSIIGCSTAGEIVRGDYSEHSLSGIHLPRSEYSVQTHVLEDLASYSSADAESLGRSCRDFLANVRLEWPEAKPFLVLLIDGLSVLEERIVSLIESHLPNVPILGGSAGDGLNFQKTTLLARGTVKSNRAIALFVATRRPFCCFKSQHFVPSEDRLVITKADPETRVVYEIDGEPASVRYARLLGKTPGTLTPKDFAEHPILFRLWGEDYVRSIQKELDDRSLLFYCAIEEGMVLRTVHQRDICAVTRDSLRQARDTLGEITVTVAFECILRRLEVLNQELVQQLSEIYREYRVNGFHTYGEQFGSVHINQTLTGVALK